MLFFFCYSTSRKCMVMVDSNTSPLVFLVTHGVGLGDRVLHLSRVFFMVMFFVWHLA